MFEPKRFINLLKLDFNIYGKKIFLAPIIVNILFVFIIFSWVFFYRFVMNSITPINNLIPNYINPNFFFFISLFIGIVFSSNSFKHLHYEEKAISFYMVAASQFEKFLSILLYYFLFYLIFSLFSTLLGFMISNIIIFIFTGKSYPLGMIFEIIDYREISTYLFIVSIFMLGSTYFKNSSFLKTLFFILILFFTFSLILSTTTLIYLRSNQNYLNVNLTLIQIMEKFGINYKNIPIISQITKIILSLFFYFLTYLRVIEYDVKGE